MDTDLMNIYLDKLYEKFGSDTVFVPLSHIAKYLKKDVRTLQADRTFPIKDMKRRGKMQHNVPLIGLARWLAKAGS